MFCLVYVLGQNRFRCRGARIRCWGCEALMRGCRAWQILPGAPIQFVQPARHPVPGRDGRGRTGPFDSCCTNSMTVSFRSGHGAFPPSESAGAEYLVHAARRGVRAVSVTFDTATAGEARSRVGLSDQEKSDVFCCDTSGIAG
jgi:hypothetical protein